MPLTLKLTSVSGSTFQEPVVYFATPRILELQNGDEASPLPAHWDYSVFQPMP